MKKSDFPNFLCIGAPKSATTWLHFNLREHPEVWMPPIKELRYFGRTAQTPLILHIGRKGRDQVRTRAIWRNLRQNPLWTIRYLFLVRNDSWYQSLFQPAPTQICGEVTPNYALLTQTIITGIKQLSPNAKILYLLREPVDRVWSHMKMWTARRYDQYVDELSVPELNQIISSNLKSIHCNSDYVGNLTRWASVYPSTQIWVGFYDQLTANPTDFFKQILHFLDVAADDKFIPANIDAARSHRPSKPIPAEIRHRLTGELYPHIEDGHHHFDNPYTAHWLQKAQTTLASHD